jgi:hypothetical protein
MQSSSCMYKGNARVCNKAAESEMHEYNVVKQLYKGNAQGYATSQ